MYRDFNKNATAENCSKWFDQVIDTFLEADLPCYRTFIATIQNWHQEILNSFQRPYDDRKESNALAENINGSLREAITVSRGLSNFDRFRARSIYSLNKHLTYSITDNLKSRKREGKERGQYTKTAIDSKITDTDDTEPLKD